MEYEDELDRMRNRKRRPAVRQTEIKNRPFPDGTQSRKNVRARGNARKCVWNMKIFPMQGRRTGRGRQSIQRRQAVLICLEVHRQRVEENREMVSQRCIRWQPRTGRREPRKKRESRK